jgi:N-acetyl-gamma-glutamyl-phosphate reductase
MMLALAPLVDDLDGVPCVFGVSGYSGAGTTPSPRNDPRILGDNILPYQLADHTHEREVAHQLGHPIRFAPHVAPFFRGITATVMATLRAPTTVADLGARFDRFYEGRPLVRVTGENIPLVRDAAGDLGATIGGLTVSAADPRNISIVATLDNLLKGAASQAIQNLNLACGFDPLEGLDHDPTPVAENQSGA